MFRRSGHVRITVTAEGLGRVIRTLSLDLGLMASGMGVDIAVIPHIDDAGLFIVRLTAGQAKSLLDRIPRRDLQEYYR